MAASNGTPTPWPNHLGVFKRSAEFTQECLLCHHAILAGSPVVCGAVNHFTEEPVWMHERCGDWYLETFGPRKLVDDGWRIAVHSQRCNRCLHSVRSGERLYREWRWLDRDQPFLRYTCHSCWRVAHQAHTEA
jgi:hypothetical protein